MSGFAQSLLFLTESEPLDDDELTDQTEEEKQTKSLLFQVFFFLGLKASKTETHT